MIGARIGSLAGTNQVLVSQTLKDLTAGSGFTFEEAGEYELKGVPDASTLSRAMSANFAASLPPPRPRAPA